MGWKKKVLFTFLIHGALLLNTGCFKNTDPESVSSSSTTTTDSGPCIASGDILVSNQGSDAIVSFDSEGNFKKIVASFIGNTQTYAGLTYLEETNEILAVVDGTDRIEAISLEDCSVRNLILNSNIVLTVTSGITVLSGGDVLVSEGNTVERVTISGGIGIRSTTNGWPKTLQTAGTELAAGDNNTFLQCSTTTDRLRWYDNSGVQIGLDQASGIAATTDATACMVLADGSVAGVWSGTTDTVSVYASDFSSTLASYSDVSILSTPRGIAEDAEGNLYVAEYTLGYIVKLDSDLNFVKIIGQGVLYQPAALFVVP